MDPVIEMEGYFYHSSAVQIPYGTETLPLSERSPVRNLGRRRQAIVYLADYPDDVDRCRGRLPRVHYDGAA